MAGAATGDRLFLFSVDCSTHAAQKSNATGGKKMDRKITRQDMRDAAEKYKNWGKRGPKDEIGTLKFTQAEDIVAAAQVVRKGKVISLALNVDNNGPQGAIVAPAIPITGAVGSPTNPLAIR